MRVTYTGPSVAVDLLGPNDETIRVDRGGVIDLPDEFAVALIQQASWEQVPEPEEPEIVEDEPEAPDDEPEIGESDAIW